MKKMHYGIMVDSEVPITGVFNNNDMEFLNDELYGAISLYWHYHDQECKNEDHDLCSPDSDTYLIGFIYNESTKRFEEDPNAEWSAIVDCESFYTTQVTKSKWVMRGRLCSPCFPGQAEPTPGNFLMYAPPPDLFGDFGDKDIKNRIFPLTQDQQSEDQATK